MRILYITPRFPYPPFKGDQAVAYNRLRLLSQSHEITLLSLYEKEEELDGLKHIEPFCTKVHVIRLRKYQSLRNILFRGLFSNLPLQVLYYQSPDFKKALENLLRENDFDLIHGFMLRIAEYLKQIQLPKVLDLNDSMQLNLKQRLAMESPFKRWILKKELCRITTYEQEVGNAFDHMIVVAEKDKDFFPFNNISVVPLGVDTEKFSPSETIEQKYTLVFSGNMSYAPNIHAVQWFVKQCLPIVKKEVSSVSLLIAGSNPGSEVMALAQCPGVQVSGFVKSMCQTLNQSYISIAPMQSGSGMQFKILEAMACGLPVIVTALGLGNIKAVDGHEIIVANTPESFSQKILELIGNPVIAKRIGQHARDYVIRNHSWEYANQLVGEIYDQVK